MPSTDLKLEAASFKDPSGQVFHQGRRVIRALDAESAQMFRKIHDTGLLGKMIATGSVVNTWDATSEFSDLTADNRWSMVLEHQRIPVITYPFEWCFEMLRESALTTLNLVNELLTSNLILKDGSPYNIQFIGTKPTFIDVGSIGELSDNQGWQGYRQFCQLFLYPLLLASYKHIHFQPLLRGRTAGIEPGEARKFFRKSDYMLHPSLLLHVFMQAKLATGGGDSNASIMRHIDDVDTIRTLVHSNINKLVRMIDRLRPPPATSQWSHYGDVNHYSDPATESKEKFVLAAAERLRPKRALDLGANTGNFSRIISSVSDYVVAADMDQQAVERNFEICRAEGYNNILPVVFDLADPSPNQGWRLSEQSDLLSRVRPDFVLALALVHHMVFTYNVPLAQFVEWLRSLDSPLVVEWVPIDDPMTKKISTAATETRCAAYTSDHFETLIDRHFKIEQKLDVPDTNRILFFLEPGVS